MQGFLEWGWQDGCKFIDEECGQLLNVTGQNEFCKLPEAGLAPPNTCSHDLRSFGKCSGAISNETCGVVSSEFSCVNPSLDRFEEETHGFHKDCAFQSLAMESCVNDVQLCLLVGFKLKTRKQHGF